MPDEQNMPPDGGVLNGARNDSPVIYLRPTLDSPVDELAIRYGYLYLLGREPESDEVVQALLSVHRATGGTIRDARAAGMASEEYKLCHGLQDAELGSPMKDDVLRPDLPPRPLLFYGGCILEAIIAAAGEAGSRTDHLVHHGYIHHPPPAPAHWDYDAVVFSPVLRVLMAEAGGWIGHEPWDGDLKYLRLAEDASLREAALGVLDRIIDRMREAVPSSLPLILMAFLEPPPTSAGVFQTRSGIYRLVRDLNDRMAERAEREPGLLYLEVNDLLRRFGDDDLYDGYVEWYTHAGVLSNPKNPFARAVFARIDTMLRALSGAETVKLIITDLDNTLWKGVLAEQDEISPREATEGWPLAYVEALLACKNRGMVLAICSKNDEETTRRNFDLVWRERITLGDFASVRINWRPKSENIAEILAEVNVLPEHAVFIDDNPLEIEEIRRVFPQMMFLTGDQRRWREELLYGPRFQVARISAESARRTELVQARIERERSLAAGADREAYLRDLQMKVQVRRIAGAEDPVFARAVELVNKTNQFNTTGERWQAGELAEKLANGMELYALRAEDRLANHGWVSMALMDGAVIHQWVFSCRVFGVGLEEAFLHFLQQGRPPLRVRWQETGRNAVAREFLNQRFAPDGEESWILREPPSWPAHLARAEMGVTEAA